MKRLWPKSLVGQLLALVALALLVAQAINMVLLYRGAERQHTVGASAAVVARMAGVLERLESGQAFPRRGFRSRHIRPKVTRESVVLDNYDRLPDVEQRALQAFGDVGFAVVAVRAAKVRELPASMSGNVVGWHRARGKRGRDQIERHLSRKFRERHEKREVGGFILLSVQLEDQNWLSLASVVRKQPQVILWRLATQTLLLYLVLLVPLILIGRQISKPLKALTVSARNFRGTGFDSLEPTGPEDVQDLTQAFNEMRGRVGNMLNEKDVMLGAIGHDLRTPLAALRVRIENVEDAAERERMIGGIEDMDRTLDDILSLARLGRSQEQAEPTDISALIETVVDEFSDLGDNVSFERPERMTADIKATLVRRSLRNLVSNAIKYGRQATISVEKTGDMLAIYVDDQGKGIADDQIEAMFEPFARAETSRNRATGGSGLGLTLARAIARDHGGDVTLSNRVQGGLRAALTLPRSS